MSKAKKAVASGDKSQLVFNAIAKSLVEFGYQGITASMIEDVWNAMKKGEEKLPHGVIGAFAESQLNDACEMGLLSK